MLRRIAASAGVALGVALVAVFAIEGLLRAAGIAYPDFFRDDPVIGRSLRPGAHGWWKTEGTAYVEINSDGMRDREHAIAKPPDTLRIAVLGGSYAAGFEVNREATYWSEIERAVASCPAAAGRTVEVLNFGLGGAGTAQQRLILEERVWKYAPDVVLLGVHTASDVADNSRALKGSSRAPYYVRDERGALVLDPEFLAKRARMSAGPLSEIWLAAFNRSRVLQTAAEARRRLRAIARKAETPPSEARGGETGVDPQIYAPSTDPEWVRAWAITEDLLRAVIADVRARGAGFLLATLTNAIQVHPDVGVRERHAAQLGVPDLLHPDRRIEAVARKEGVAFRMLAPPLGEWAAKHETCLHGFAEATPCSGSWNEHGHRLAGESLAASLCREVIPALGPAVAGQGASVRFRAP